GISDERAKAPHRRDGWACEREDARNRPLGPRYPVSARFPFQPARRHLPPAGENYVRVRSLLFQYSWTCRELSLFLPLVYCVAPREPLASRWATPEPLKARSPMPPEPRFPKPR